MNDKDLNKIKNIAENHRMQPSAQAWDKLNSKLKAKNTKVRLINYRNISIAAILISVISVVSVFSLYLNDHNPKVFSSNEEFRPIVLEELQVLDTDPFFDIGNIRILKDAYSVNGMEFDF